MLVVDDSAIFRTYWARALSGKPDIEVIGSAKDGREAVEIVRRETPHVVILDLEMPVMDGIEAIPRIHTCDGEAGCLRA